MRKELEKILGVRGEFTAEVKRFGSKSGYRGRPPIETVLLVDIKDSSGKVVANHQWFTVGIGIASADLVEGDIVSLAARVKRYEKGYKGHDWTKRIEKPINTDYCLGYPSKVKKIENNLAPTKSSALDIKHDPPQHFGNSTA